MESTQSKHKEINLSEVLGANNSMFSGRPQGEDSRKTFRLDQLDKNENLIIDIVIPKITTSISPSFFLGFLYSSIKDLGYEKFSKKYNFIFDDSIDSLKRKIILNDINEALRSARNSLKRNYGLKDIF
ncbi:hypothetical protein [Echinicola shivajiensis]|uniref:hypothetical protein n=1 Tax=Echinicola shivajiensis TaxID=1035916 RepID=UPI001BFC3578|nr:hypothetical protein [Echinicola shivajiensis]